MVLWSYGLRLIIIIFSLWNYLFTITFYFVYVVCIEGHYFQKFILEIRYEDSFADIFNFFVLLSSYWGHTKLRHHRVRWVMAMYYPQKTTLSMGPTGIL